MKVLFTIWAKSRDKEQRQKATKRKGTKEQRNKRTKEQRNTGTQEQENGRFAPEKLDEKNNPKYLVYTK